MPDASTMPLQARHRLHYAGNVLQAKACEVSVAQAGVGRLFVSALLGGVAVAACQVVGGDSTPACVRTHAFPKRDVRARTCAAVEILFAR